MMRVLYFGTVCNLELYEELLEGCQDKPTVATIVFETALLDGLKKNGVDVEIHSFPMIPTFPKSNLLYWGRKKENLACGYKCEWLSTINIPIIKQLSRRLDAKRVLKNWIRENKDEGVIFTYSIPPFLVKDVIRFSRKNSIKTVAIIPDLLRDMYINSNPKSFVTKLKRMYLKPALKLQSEYNGYIYLTEAMSDIVAPRKPYMVMEGIANTINVESQDKTKKSFPRAIMYAGMLHEKYGIKNLLDAFENLQISDVELWLFGEGTAVEEIKKRAERNCKIRYWGRKERWEILKYEKRATLLINPRNVEDEFTKFSFPSKTIEYMLSGTPLITTKLEGIPDSYFEYLFVAEDNKVMTLTNAMRQALSLSMEELDDFGVCAKEYIVREKNAINQTRRIVDFIGGIGCP